MGVIGRSICTRSEVGSGCVGKSGLEPPNVFFNPYPANVENMVSS